MGVGGAVGVPLYFLTKDALGSSGAATVMVLVMLPAFFFAMYERDGLPLEKVLWNMFKVKYVKPAKRENERGGMDGKKQSISVAED